MEILINGKILFRKITGVERYARETLSEIDKKISYHQYKLAIPSYYNEADLPKYKNFELVKIDGLKKDFLWEQISLPIYAKKNNALIVSFDFATPIFNPGISTIHDMSFKTNKNYFTNNLKQKMVRLKLESYCNSIIKGKYPIVTVSHYQKKEIEKYYHIDPKRIIVAGNGWQHFKEVEEDDSVLSEYDIIPGEFYFSLSSNTSNKNFKWVYEAAKANSHAQFVIVGGKTSISPNELRGEKNISYLGYQSDERVKSLYKNCKAFIFPSFYEGFGIPPMEALSVGAKIIVSNTSCLPEIYGDSAYYIDPRNSNINLEDILEGNVTGNPEDVLNKYSWDLTADKWIEQLERIKNSF
jgi:glycosyltransferase involved in cell wall biosynthesis